MADASGRGGYRRARGDGGGDAAWGPTGPSGRYIDIEGRPRGLSAPAEARTPPKPSGPSEWIKDRRVQVALVAALALIGVTLWSALSGPSTEEDRVRLVIDEIEEGLLDKKPGAVMEHIDERYHDSHGLDHRLARLYLAQASFRGQRIFVQRAGGTDVVIDPDGARATASFRAVIAEGSGLDALGNLGHFDFDVDLVKGEDDAWRVISHRRRAR